MTMDSAWWRDKLDTSDLYGSMWGDVIDCLAAEEKAHAITLGALAESERLRVARDHMLDDCGNKILALKAKLAAVTLDNARPREVVGWFAREMERQLKANDSKGHWDECDRRWLTAQARVNLSEIDRLCLADKDAIVKAAADAANFCMMIADNQTWPRPALASAPSDVPSAASLAIDNARLTGVLLRLAEPMSGFSTEHAREIIRAALTHTPDAMVQEVREVLKRVRGLYLPESVEAAIDALLEKLGGKP
jgi:hypothetical protein